MRESRLFKIVYILLGGGKVTASSLSKELEVSVRTIYRDIDSLSAAGVPIYTETGRNGGVFLPEDFTLDKVVFSKEEKQDLLYSLQSLTVAGGVNIEPSLSKLSALFNVENESWFEVDFSRWGHNSDDSNKFNLLKKAILNNTSVDITYVDSYGSKSRRIINPLKFFYKSKEWYIKSYCNKSGDFRLFKFNRITKASLTEKKFIPSIYPEYNHEQEPKYEKVVLRFSKTSAYRVYDEFSSDQIVDEDGELIVTSYMPEDSWLVSYLLAFGSNVEVIEPLYLKDILKEEAYKIYLKNKM